MNRNFIQSTNEITFEELYKKYAPDLILYVRYTLNQPDEIAKDLTSEAFTILFEKWETFDPKQYPVLISWLRKTVRFLSYNLNRKAQRLPTISMDLVINGENLSDPFGDYVYQEDIQLIKNKLTEQEYQLFENIVIYNRTIKQISKIMDMNTNTLTVRWFRLKNKIRQFLR